MPDANFNGGEQGRNNTNVMESPSFTSAAHVLPPP